MTSSLLKVKKCDSLIILNSSAAVSLSQQTLGKRQDSIFCPVDLLPKLKDVEALFCFVRPPSFSAGCGTPPWMWWAAFTTLYGDFLLRTEQCCTRRRYSWSEHFLGSPVEDSWSWYDGSRSVMQPPKSMKLLTLSINRPAS